MRSIFRAIGHDLRTTSYDKNEWSIAKNFISYTPIIQPYTLHYRENRNEWMIDDRRKEDG